MSASRALLTVLAALAAPGCSGGRAGLAGPAASLPDRPAPRESGARLPAFAGGDPVARGWRKVDDLLWVGEGGALPERRTLPAGTPPEEGFLLRTDHVSLRTNLSWPSGVRLARLAQTHVRLLFERYGEAFDLRFPSVPLAVVACARREEFRARLRGAVPDDVAWGAFYDSRSGTVFVCEEPAPHGALPLEADLRHEMTHQVLDLSTPSSGRSRIFEGEGHWLWEGIAVHAEGLGDPAESGCARARRDRFRRRLAWGEWTPLERLFALPQREFEGRHYDQTASVMRFLLEGDGEATRAATLESVRALLHGAPGDLPRRLGEPLAEVEERWLASAGS